MGHYTGLTGVEAAKRLTQYGLNRVETKKQSFFVKLLVKLRSPITLMLVAAGVLSLISGKAFDAYVISALLILNIGIEFWQEHRADSSLTQLQQRLVVQTKVLRDGQWKFIAAEQLVPGDVIRVGVGDVVPADVRVEDATNVSVDQSALTGESLPVDKHADDMAFSGSFVGTGQMVGTVIATNNRTQYGKILMAVQGMHKRSLLEQDVLRQARFLAYVSIGSVIVLDFALLLFDKTTYAEALRLDLSLVIAGIPVSLPTVMALIISIGVIMLSQKGAVVRRLSALQNLADVTLLLSDKTGTLTENKLQVTGIIHYDHATDDQILRLAATAAQQETRSIIDDTIKAAAKAKHISLDHISLAIPADSTRKRNTVIADGSVVVVGAPFVVFGVSRLTPTLREQCEKDVAAAAQKGYRTLAVAHSERGTKEKDLTLVGLLMLSDEPRLSAKAAVTFMQQEGVAVKMVTGDTLPIAKRVAEQVAIRGEISSRTDFAKQTTPAQQFTWLQRHGGLAEALPEDKLALVQASLKSEVVAVTGDGINDLPAMSAADVGIAVEGAVDATRSSADIIFTRAGLAAIKNAVIEARTIFARLYSYSLYRISESFRLIISIALLGVMYGEFPLTPLQIVLIAFLNDIPIISLAYDHVLTPHSPAKINVRERFKESVLFGIVGVANSVILFLLMYNVWHLPIAVIQTAYFLKLTVSGHMLIYVAHTSERWWRFLPSKQVIIATTATQLLATTLAVSGWLVSAIPLWLVGLVWLWSLGWMQVAELTKWFRRR